MPKFNPWNLPEKAKVLLISALPGPITKPEELFNLFSNYGDVNRVKILRKRGTNGEKRGMHSVKTTFYN